MSSNKSIRASNKSIRASNKSIVASKKTISRTMFLDVLKKNKEFNSLKTSLNNNKIRCKLLWYTLIKLNEQIDNFEQLYSSLNIKSQEKLLDKLLKESLTIHEKYIECGEINDDLQYTIDEVIYKLRRKYNIVDPKIPTIYISKYAEGTRGNRSKRGKKNKKSKHKRKYRSV